MSFLQTTYSNHIHKTWRFPQSLSFSRNSPNFTSTMIYIVHFFLKWQMGLKDWPLFYPTFCRCPLPSPHSSRSSAGWESTWQWVLLYPDEVTGNLLTSQHPLSVHEKIPKHSMIYIKNNFHDVLFLSSLLWKCFPQQKCTEMRLTKNDASLWAVPWKMAIGKTMAIIIHTEVST